MEGRGREGGKEGGDGEEENDRWKEKGGKRTSEKLEKEVKWSMRR